MPSLPLFALGSSFIPSALPLTQGEHLESYLIWHQFGRGIAHAADIGESLAPLNP